MPKRNIEYRRNQAGRGREILLNQLTLSAFERYISNQRSSPFGIKQVGQRFNIMSLTLGEKLRQAREERGFTLSEVSEQTRISSLYLESIENDNYRILPGGIFNKGFVKSYAKFVGINEQEALLDYAQLVSVTAGNEEPEFKVYKPEVLTDDRSTASMMPTIILAVVILALMTAGILFLLNYLRQPTDPVATNTPQKTNVNSVTGTQANANTETAQSNTPDMATLKVDFKALSEPVSLSATSDGQLSTNVVTAGSTVTFEPKESLKLSYSRSLASFVQLTINGKAITPPAVPLNPKRNVIEFEINKGNLAQIWASGAISADVSAVTPDTNSNAAAATSNTTATVPTQVRPSPSPKPTAGSNTNAITKPTPDRKPIETPKPAVMLPKPVANRP